MLAKVGDCKVRVISGDKKGHRLSTPKGNDVRPTEDRVKESLFNIISPLKKDAVILDLFAGSGGIGIEFLSRGAARGYFIDRSQESITVINKNLVHTKLQDKAVVIKGGARLVLKRLANEKTKFDYIYIDPPFNDEKLFHSILESIAQSDVISLGGIVIVEHDKTLDLPDCYYSLRAYDTRNYGRKQMTYYRIGE